MSVSLDSIPEFQLFSRREIIGDDGSVKYIPVANTCGPLYHDDPLAAVDENGTEWRFVRVDGVLHKVKY